MKAASAVRMEGIMAGVLPRAIPPEPDSKRPGVKEPVSLEPEEAPRLRLVANNGKVAATVL